MTKHINPKTPNAVPTPALVDGHNGGDAACPAAAIGRQIERLYAEWTQREDHAAIGWNVRSNVGQVPHLIDRMHALEVQLEWVKATSVAGALAQVNLINRWLFSGEADDNAVYERRLRRLVALVQASLAALAQVREHELGGAACAVLNEDFGEVLFRHTGEDIRAEDRQGAPLTSLDEDHIGKAPGAGEI